MALTPSGARVRSLVSARESKRGELTGSVLTYNTLKPGSRLFQRLAWPRRIKHWSAGGRYGHMPHSLPFTFTFSAGLPHLHPCLPLLWTAGPDVPRHHRRRRGPTHRGVRGERGAAAGQCGTQQAVTGRTRWPCRGAQPSTAWRCPPGQGSTSPGVTLSEEVPVVGKHFLRKVRRRCPIVLHGGGPCGAELTVRGNMQRRLGYWRKNCGGLRADRQLASLPGGGVGGRPCEGGAGGGGRRLMALARLLLLQLWWGEGAMQVQAGGGYQASKASSRGAFAHCICPHCKTGGGGGVKRGRKAGG